MSTIDLERLRVRQTFFVPLRKKELEQAILNELNEYLGDRLYHPPAWIIERHGNTTIFEVNYQYIYVLLFNSGKPTKEEVKNRLEEYDGKNRIRFFSKL